MFYRIRIGAAIAALLVVLAVDATCGQCRRRGTGMESDRGDAHAQRDSGPGAG